LVVFLIAIIGATPLPKKVVKSLSKNQRVVSVLNYVEPIVMIILLLVTTGYLVDGSFNPFLYFRF